MLKEDIVIYESVPVILNTDKVLETQGEPAPGMGLKFRQVDEKSERAIGSGTKSFSGEGSSSKLRRNLFTSSKYRS